jgi:hypothetical protein
VITRVILAKQHEHVFRARTRYHRRSVMVNKGAGRILSRFRSITCFDYSSYKISRLGKVCARPVCEWDEETIGWSEKKSGRVKSWLLDSGLWEDFVQVGKGLRLGGLFGQAFPVGQRDVAKRARGFRCSEQEECANRHVLKKYASCFGEARNPKS